MKIRIMLAGVAGAILLFAWTFVANVFFGLGPSIAMNQPANMEEVYHVLKENIVSPGGYVVQSEANKEGPTDDPVFSVSYSGLSHADAGMTMLWQILCWLIAATLVAKLLSMTNERILRSYPRKLLFVVATGFLIAVTSDLPQYDIGRLPLNSVLMLAMSSLVGWTWVGIAMAKIVHSRH